MPIPDEPSSATVRPGTSCARRSSRPSPVTFDTAWTGTPKAICSISATYVSTSSTRSVFVRTTAGEAPLSHAVVR